jgi:hypothetical protein
MLHMRQHGSFILVIRANNNRYGIVKLTQTPVTVRHLGHEKHQNVCGLSLPISGH